MILGLVLSVKRGHNFILGILRISTKYNCIYSKKFISVLQETFPSQANSTQHVCGTVLSRKYEYIYFPSEVHSNHTFKQVRRRRCAWWWYFFSHEPFYLREPFDGLKSVRDGVVLGHLAVNLIDSTRRTRRISSRCLLTVIILPLVSHKKVRWVKKQQSNFIIELRSSCPLQPQNIGEN